MNNLELVRERVSEAKAIAWDTCHKIYLLMDDEQVELMRGYEYDPLITKEEMTSEEMSFSDFKKNEMVLHKLFN
jgi:hypothetical protein